MNYKQANLKQPVVAVMGHVDHGKTTFLDTVCGTCIVNKEAGGITQNTRAHEVTLSNGFKITFIDTPGHELFTNMRLNSAKITDFVLLIVAADDGVKPQTRESINFAKSLNVPIIVAINKIDLPGVNIQKIKNELSSHGVLIEEFGGDSLCFEISAKHNIGVDKLLEGIQLLTEINEIKVSTTQSKEIVAEAFVLESVFDKKIGNVCLCILKSGYIKDVKLFAYTNDQYFKVKNFLDYKQNIVNYVYPSKPFWLVGLKKSVSPGEIIYFVESEEIAKLKVYEHSTKIAESNSLIVEQQKDPYEVFLDILRTQTNIKEGKEKCLYLIIKSKTQSTLEAILQQLSVLSNSLANTNVRLNILFTGVGEVTKEDINRAVLANSIILTFQLPTNSVIRKLAQREKVFLKNYDVIYEMFNELNDLINAMKCSDHVNVEVEVARAKIKKIFLLSDNKQVFGCEVTSGVILRGSNAKFIKVGESSSDNIELGRGKIVSLKILKDDVKEVKKGQECGICVDKYIQNISEGDFLVVYKVEK
ncbi:MAG: GTP-binding protein [Candidatus Dojkabacteria bacterium]|nr:GTP-binding protein [Candidatus Dojkabacteria bacterium]